MAKTVARVSRQVTVPGIGIHRELAEGIESRVDRLSSGASPCPSLIDTKRLPAELETVEQYDGVQG